MEITQEQLKQGAELMQTLIQKAWDNPEFKNQLVKNPENTISQVIEKEFNLPEGQKVVVEDQTDDSIIYLNIPRKISFDSLELTEEELELVAGGVTPAAFLYGVGMGIAIWAATHQ